MKEKEVQAMDKKAKEAFPADPKLLKKEAAKSARKSSKTFKGIDISYTGPPIDEGLPF